jgi:arginyl-tRNA synthetase
LRESPGVPFSASTPALDAATELAARIVDAARAVTGLELSRADALLRPGSARHGADFQANLAMALARRLGRDPRDLATELVEQVDLDGVATAAVAGSGFINFRLEATWIAGALAATAADPRLGAGSRHAPERVVVDYSGPNIAKEMHVGHLRSTIIGDALARLLRFVGDDVIAQNHVGDWGTQFGMLIEELDATPPPADPRGHTIADLDGFYRQARLHFDRDPAFADRARARVVALQAGDPTALTTWRELVNESQRHFDVVYHLLGTRLTATAMAGESTYNDSLADTVDELGRAGLLELDDGALCAFPPGFKNRDGHRMPLIVRKSDGGYTYDTTDLAAIRHRRRALAADRLLYVVGAPQSQHLEMVFTIARAAGWLGDAARAEHVAFGSVLGDDGKILRTRSGENVKLVDLLREAVRQAAQGIADRTAADPDDELARQVGIGAVKYADLSGDRIKDYVFSFDRMLSLDGNTSVYLQYAHARVLAILRRAGPVAPAAGIAVAEEAERALALQLLQFGTAVDRVASSLAPHHLCTHLHATATAFSNFYERCPILKAADPQTRASRLELARHTGRVLGTGLDLLGIDAPDRL